MNIAFLVGLLSSSYSFGSKVEIVVFISQTTCWWDKLFLRYYLKSFIIANVSVSCKILLLLGGIIVFTGEAREEVKLCCLSMGRLGCHLYDSWPS